ncbi:unnamed protein product [Rotaria sordida]|uniref:Sodium-coupled monocarboxylate transporter 1 n=1 Tax=Rotaria sordida TaxID=392033 RepID=A0A819I2F1_9BILA|nr:unnamed protein product [Rotaria sordida]
MITFYFMLAISWGMAAIVTGFVFVPKFREMQFTSAYEGGLKAIIWTDVIQAVVMFIGLFAVIIQGLVTLGGWKRTFARASRGGRIELDSFDPRTRHTIWSLLIGGFFNSFATFAFNQAQIQRYMCIHSTRGAKQALLINAVGSGILILLSVFIGIIVYAYYADCDPYTAKQIQEIDQILPYFVMEVLSDKKGLPGVFLACVFSGSLSTISSGLNSLAAVIIEDFYKGLMGRKLTDQRQVSYIWYSAIAVSTVVLVGIIVSYLTRSLESEEIDPKLIIPISDVCYCLLPKQWRKRRECGIEDEAYRKKQVPLFEYFHS